MIGLKRGSGSPRITFGMIVLNGMPFLPYNLRALYPFAHQIIVVEGASPDAACIAAADGHSTDGTLDVLAAFKRKEDPEDKILVVTAEDQGYSNGFWPGEKDEQSRAYAARATGEYLWQVDVDEFYQPGDMLGVLEMLAEDPEITAVSFWILNFWGSLDYLTDGWYLRRGGAHFHRLFRWQQSYDYRTHRPPTIYDSQGRDLRSLKWITGRDLARRGIRLYHYSLLFPRQVLEKCEYYRHAKWTGKDRAGVWAERNFLGLSQPFRVHNVYDHPSWLERYRGPHPPQVKAMWKDIQEGRWNVELRHTEDIERLIGNRLYRWKRLLVKAQDYPDRLARGWYGLASRALWTARQGVRKRIIFRTDTLRR